MTDKSKSEIRKHMLKTQNKLRINFFKKKLSVCTSGPTEENFTTLLRVFRRNSESFFFRLQKNLLDWIFFKKITSNCSSGQIGCSFVNQAESILNVWRFFRKFWKPFWWKKILSWEKASWKTPQNAVFTIAAIFFWESLKSSRSNSDTSIANTQPCRHFFC